MKKLITILLILLSFKSFSQVKDTVILKLSSGNTGTVTNITATNGYGQNWTIINSSSTPNLSLLLDTFYTGFATRLRLSLDSLALINIINGKQTILSGTGYVKFSGTTPSYISAIPNTDLANSAINIAGNSTSLGGSVTQDAITGLSSTGIIKRTATNTLGIAISGTDYVIPSTLNSYVKYTDTSTMLSNYPIKDGTRATGTWGISVTGSAGSLLNSITNGYGINSFSYNGSGTGVVIADTTKLIYRSTIPADTANYLDGQGRIRSFSTVDTKSFNDTTSMKSYTGYAIYANMFSSTLGGIFYYDSTSSLALDGKNVFLSSKGSGTHFWVRAPNNAFLQLTTTGTSGSASLSGSVLNIPNYSSVPFNYTLRNYLTGYNTFSQILLDSLTLNNVNTITGITTGARWTNKKLIVYGASVELGLNSTTYSTDSWVAKLSYSANANLINKAITSTSFQKVTLGDSSFIDRLYTIPTYDTSYQAFIFGASNILNDYSLSISTSGISAAFTLAINSIISKGWPLYKIFLATPTVIGAFTRPTGGKTMDSLKIYSNLYAAAANAAGVKVIDNFNFMQQQKVAYNTYVSSDSIHPNNSGHYTAFENAATLLGSINSIGHLRVDGTTHLLDTLISEQYTTLSNGGLINGNITVNGYIGLGNYNFTTAGNSINTSNFNPTFTSTGSIYTDRKFINIQAASTGNNGAVNTDYRIFNKQTAASTSPNFINHNAAFVDSSGNLTTPSIYQFSGGVTLASAGTTGATIFKFNGNNIVNYSTIASLTDFAGSTAATGTGTITQYVGLNIRDQAVTSAYYGAAFGGTSGTGKYNIYASGTAQNYIRGFVGLGASASTPASALHIATGSITGAAWSGNGGILREDGGGFTYTDNTTSASGTIATASQNSFRAMSYATTNTGITVTDLSNVLINGAPTAGTNVTATNTWGLYVIGNTKLAGLSVNVGSDATGDLHYRASTGLLTRTPIGTSGQILTSSGTAPVWSTVRTYSTSQITGTDANITASAGTTIYLPAATLTANRTIDMTNLNTDLDYIVIANNEAGFTWSFTGQSVYYADGVTTITNLYANANYIIQRINGKLRIIN